MTPSTTTEYAAGERPEPVVECNSLVREYTRGSSGTLFDKSSIPIVRAVDDVTFQIGAGEFVGISGPSGSGKSTLLHLLAALDTPTSGELLLSGEDMTAMSERARARFRRDCVGIVFQRFHLLPSLPAVSNVALPLVERGWSKRKRRERARTLLEQVGLSDRESHRPGSLSGGERQRVAIARALATEPDLLVADEPTGELDSATSEQILDVLDGVSEDQTVIIASHDQQALDRTERRIQLRDGQIVADSHA